jgi:hypothetical protein
MEGHTALADAVAAGLARRPAAVAVVQLADPTVGADVPTIPSLTFDQLDAAATELALHLDILGVPTQVSPSPSLSSSLSDSTIDPLTRTAHLIPFTGSLALSPSAHPSGRFGAAS